MKVTKKKLKQDTDAKIEGLNKKIKEKDSQIHNLYNRLESIEESNRIKDREAYVAKKWKKVKRDTWLTILLAVLFCILWCVNEFYGKYLPTLWASIITVATFIVTTFGILFIDQTKIKDYFCRTQLTKRFEEEYDNNHKKEGSS